MAEAGNKVVVILNGGSGSGQAETVRNQIEELFGDAGREVLTVVPADGQAIDKAVDDAIASGAAAVVAGGGDGTVNAVASRLLDHDIPFGVIPLGTLNHFARDLKLPLEVEDAVGVILAGRTVRVDVGQINHRTFLNNSSLGLYPAIVKLREQRPTKGLLKWAVAAGATAKALRHNQILSVEVEHEGGLLTRETPVVFVGNNEYKMVGLAAGTRDSLSQGQLAVYVVNTVGRLAQLKLGFQVLLGTAERANELDVIRTAAATIRSRRPSLHVSYDGEVETMTGPFKYRILPKALAVFVGEADSARPTLGPDVRGNITRG
ncbi:MAG: diacylglycerol kinase family protein [Gemmatimonadota bacterium]